MFVTAEKCEVENSKICHRFKLEVIHLFQHLGKDPHKNLSLLICMRCMHSSKFMLLSDRKSAIF